VQELPLVHDGGGSRFPGQVPARRPTADMPKGFIILHKKLIHTSNVHMLLLRIRNNLQTESLRNKSMKNLKIKIF